MKQSVFFFIIGGIVVGGGGAVGLMFLCRGNACFALDAPAPAPPPREVVVEASRNVSEGGSTLEESADEAFDERAEEIITPPTPSGVVARVI